MDDALAWKKNVRKVLKKIIATTLQEAQGYLNEDATNETLEILSFHQDKLKRKINAVKTLEDEILELENDPALTEAILTESTKFEIESRRKLNLITKFIVTNTRKKETDTQTRSKQPRLSYRNLKLQNLVVMLQSGNNSTIRFSPLTTTQFH